MPTALDLPDSALSKVSLLDSAAQRAQALADQLDHDIGRIATLRFFAFVTGASSTFAGWYDSAWSTYSIPALIGWGVFMGAMWRHRRLYALAPRAKLTAEGHRAAIARVRHDWSAIEDGGERYLSDEPQERELQLFGEVSLYKLLNATSLVGGRVRLASLLKGALLSEEPTWEGHVDPVERVHLRQSAAEELADKRGLRGRVAVEAQVGGKRSAELSPLVHWAEGGSELPPGWGLKAKLGQLLVVATWAQIALELSVGLSTAWQLTLIAQLALYALTTRALSEQYASLLGEHHKALEGLSRCFERLERARFKGEGMRRWQGALLEGGAPSTHIKELSKVAEALAVRHSALLYGVLAIGFCWELTYGVKAWRWRSAHGGKVRRQLALLYDWEALASMGGMWADHTQLTWPELYERAGRPLLEAQEVNHPLFHPDTRRGNDFSLDTTETGGSFVLVTGSNMSGKSSFMRALGSNARLAFAGAPVVAERLCLPPLELATCIQVTDDPSQGWSRFYAEVRRIRALIERAEQATEARPVLYLIDEMLSGTNSRERRLASRAIASRLLATRHAAGIITTHDLDLAQLQDAHPDQISCAHFSDVFDGKRLIFDYQLKEGVATTTNALRVLWLEGIEVPELEEVP